jgi:hypothetical protein
MRWRLLKLRGELLELGSTVRQLRQAGLDGAALLLKRGGVYLEDEADAAWAGAYALDGDLFA